MASNKSKSNTFLNDPTLLQDESPHELEFTTNVAAWITLAIQNDPSLPFSGVRCERRSKGSQKRRDLTLIVKGGRAPVTGEVKLPYQKDGTSPHNAAVVHDARNKARRAGASHFFTWNVNECVLWETEASSDDPGAGQHYTSWKVVSVAKASQLVLPSTEDAIKRWLGQFLTHLANIIRGTATVGFKPPDERFIEALESALHLPIQLTMEELERRYTTKSGAAELDRWMRDEQGWTLAADPDGIRDTLERAAKFACYALVNKLVFYEALMKRYGAQLPKLNIPDHIDTGDDARLHLEKDFADAKRVTEDYETVFGEDHTNVGNRIPFYADHAVSFWRELINEIHQFDFSKLDYEIIGSIFERLISPEERHKFGQFYTRAEVVDLINSFCIRTGEEAIMDPACGGGTFLVRAYARKRELAPGRPHERMLDELFGVDISPFACHLTTINLATRDLVRDENYPRIGRTDFFNVHPNQPFLTLPSHAKIKGLGTIQHHEVKIPQLDAVIGNPPYVRQEDIKGDKATGNRHPLPGTKEYYRTLVKKEMGAELSGRSDLHCYFWPHAASFLKPDGWLCLLTSSQWLDVEYGFRLQRWILSHFKIVAIFESLDEPWFVGARVVTTATILQRCDNPEERAQNLVRFVQLRRPIAEILAHDGTTAGAIRAADDFRDEVLTLTTNVLNERYRARLVPQRTLLENGIRLGRLMRAGGEPDSEDTVENDISSELCVDDYYGGKWGLYLRAPDLWFELTDRFADSLAPLGELAKIRFGVKSGKDEFFFPRDCSQDCITRVPDARAFQQDFGVTRRKVESGEVKLVRCGEGYGEIRPIETTYLEPEVHSLMEIKGYTVDPKNCGRMILLVDTPRSSLTGTYVLKYIEWGESHGWHKGETCAARVRATREWYDLTGHARAAVLWPKERQYRHIAPANPRRLIANCRLYEIYPAGRRVNPGLWGGILNSSWTLLSSLQYGRPVGNEGNWSTMVVDANLMLVVNPSNTHKSTLRAVAQAFRALKRRAALQFLSERRLRQMAFAKGGRDAELKRLSNISELDMEDRRTLDDAVLQMLGVKNPRKRAELLEQLYTHLRTFFEQTRQKEEKAIANKNTSKRKISLSPVDIAAEVFAEIKEAHGDLLRPFSAFLDMTRPYSTFELPVDGVAEIHHDLFAAQGSVRFLRGRKPIAMIPTKTPEQAKLITLIAAYGVRGLVRLPLEARECTGVRRRYEAFVKDRDQRIRMLIAERTGDPELQDVIFQSVADLIVNRA